MASFLSESLASVILLLLTFFSFLPTTTSSHICSQAMADSLSSSGFSFFAHALRAHNLTADARLTFLAPIDSAFVHRPVDSEFLRHHVSTVGAMRYRTLLSLPPNSTLPTLDSSAHLRVFSDGEAVSFNDVPVAVPNLYVDSSCVVHGIAGPLQPVESLFDEMPEPANESGDSLMVPMKRGTQASSLSKFVRRKIH